jgi:lysylphosphatidylglycerol synthetase-like protein (DUF2156 family)
MRRPWLIELASAILIVGGLQSVLTIPDPFVPGAGIVPVLLLGLAVLTIVVGILVRAGRAWPLALNVTAVVLFLEATALPSPFAIVFLILDAIVFIALVRERAWFERRRPAPASDPARATPDEPPR